MINDEIISITYIGKEATRDIEVESADHLFYANNILTHNSSIDASEFDHSHIAGGISKINTADNVFGIFTTATMRESGKYQLQFLKTRSAAAVGQKIDLKFYTDCLRITDMDDYIDSDKEETKESSQPLGTPLIKTDSPMNFQSVEVKPGESMRAKMMDIINQNRKS